MDGNIHGSLDGMIAVVQARESALVAWVLKVIIHPEPAHTWEQVQENLTTGLLPWWVPALFVGTIVFLILLLVIAAPRSPRSETCLR